MVVRNLALISLVLLCLVLIGCEGREGPATDEGARAEPIAAAIASPAAPGSGEPFLATGADGSLLMSWLEPSGDGSHALRFARYTDQLWSEPVTISQRDDFFVNWADFPSIIETPESGMIAHWLQKSGEGPYAYDVMFALSADRGSTWSEPRVLHTDGIETEHGFVSLVPETDGSGVVGAVWLDGRNMTEGDHGHGAGSMTVRFARIHPDGSVTDRTELDDRACECCQTSMTRTDRGFVAIYRDRSDEEIRDIAMVRQTAGGWTEPTIVHPDGWKIAACPVNGPQIDARGSNLVVAWSTGASGTDRVFATFSENGGETFGEPIRIDEGNALGRVDTLMLNDRMAMVVWLGQQDDTGRILARLVERNGNISPVYTIGESGASRASGFPRITMIGNLVYAAWTDPDEPATIQIASIDAEEIS